MTAVEFIKKFGWDNSNECLNNISDPNFPFVGICGCFIEWKELKRYVDAYELVYEHGSIREALKYARSPYTAPEVSVAIMQSIRLVEQCND